MADPDPFWANATLLVETSVKFKKVMQTKGLRRAKAQCPICKNETLQGALAGRKDHMRMWCDTEGCDVQMME